MVTVAVCTYNGERYLAQQLDSILRQTTPPDEIVLCDDGSTDGTLALARDILSRGGVPFQIIQNETKLGVTKNFEQAIRLSKGELVFTSDQDDVWMPEKLRLLTEALADKAAVLAFSDAIVTDEALQPQGTGLWDSARFFQSRREQFAQEPFSVLCASNVVTGATMAVRRDFALQCMPFPTAILHDDWLALNAPLYGRVVPISLPLIEYRQHGGNAEGMRTGLWQKATLWLATACDAARFEKSVHYDAARCDAFFAAHAGEKICDTPTLRAWRAFQQDRARVLHEKGRCKRAGIVLKNMLGGNYSRFPKVMGMGAQELLFALAAKRKGTQ